MRVHILGRPETAALTFPTIGEYLTGKLGTELVVCAQVCTFCTNIEEIHFCVFHELGVFVLTPFGHMMPQWCSVS
jgi:hypothetical protein